MYFEVEQDRMVGAMSLDRETSSRARPKRHDLRLPGIDRDFNIVAMQVNNGAAVGRPAEFDSFVSRIIQHEYDHLEGVLLVDRMSAADKQRHKAALQELVDRYRSRQASPARAR